MVRQRLWNTAPSRARLRLESLEDRTVPTILNMYIISGPLTLSGDVATAPILQQGPGSLTTEFVGEIVADYNAGAQTLAFDFSSYGFGLNSGNWEPGLNGVPGTAPANYGGEINFLGRGVGAFREAIVGTGTLEALPLTPQTVGFSYPSTQYLATYYGWFDYNHPTLGFGRLNLAGAFAVNQAATAGTFIDYGVYGFSGYYQLFMPIDLRLTYDLGGGIMANLRVLGTFEAWAFPAGPVGGSGVGQTPSGDAALGYLATVGADQIQAVAVTMVTMDTLREQSVPQVEQPSPQVSEDAFAIQAPAQHQTPLEQVFAELFTGDILA